MVHRPGEYGHPPIFRIPEAAPDVWREVEHAHRLLEDLGEALAAGVAPELAGVLTPIRCLTLAFIGRDWAFGVTPASWRGGSGCTARWSRTTCASSKSTG